MLTEMRQKETKPEIKELFIEQSSESSKETKKGSLEKNNDDDETLIVQKLYFGMHRRSS